ncbi:MAG: DUF397 domain-containing protein [Corynebacteriales bacterium]|nr:DUF397 domain-containing protein [Mycobacteriales bacterium]
MANRKRIYVKSSRSGGSGGNCVEWAIEPKGVYVRDSKNSSGPELLLTHQEWNALVRAAGSGTDHPYINLHAAGARIRKDGTELAFTSREWVAFTAAAIAGECHNFLAV